MEVMEDVWTFVFMLKQGVILVVYPQCLKAAGKTPDDLTPGIRIADKKQFFAFTKGKTLALDDCGSSEAECPRSLGYGSRSFELSVGGAAVPSGWQSFSPGLRGTSYPEESCPAPITPPLYGASKLDGRTFRWGKRLVRFGQPALLPTRIPGWINGDT
jgi:hypothetical protein